METNNSEPERLDAQSSVSPADKNTTFKEQKYKEFINLIQSGFYEGNRDNSLMKIVWAGALAGLSEAQIEAELSSCAPDMAAAISRAARKVFSQYVSKSNGTYVPHQTSLGETLSPQRKAEKRCVSKESGIWFKSRKFMARATDSQGENPPDEAALLALSPVKIDWSPEQDATELLKRLYKPDDILFIGEQYSKTVKSVAAWLNLYPSVFQHIIPNPLTGITGLTKEGKESFRADSCVASFRFSVVEFDNMPKGSQVAFWLYMLNHGLPVAALIDSGGKSIHGWIAVNCSDREEWENEVENKLFKFILVPCGVDGACKNEARLSRLPGHYRSEKSKWQRLLYLNPNAGREKK